MNDISTPKQQVLSNTLNGASVVPGVGSGVVVAP